MSTKPTHTRRATRWRLLIGVALLTLLGAACSVDTNGDGYPDVVVNVGEGGAPAVRIVTDTGTPPLPPDAWVIVDSGCMSMDCMAPAPVVDTGSPPPLVDTGSPPPPPEEAPVLDCSDPITFGCLWYGPPG